VGEVKYEKPHGRDGRYAFFAMSVFDSNMICYNVNIHSGSDGNSFLVSWKQTAMLHFKYTSDRRACYYMM
jgi:hypothetical protein